MPFYEVIFENGNVSVANYKNDQEAIGALRVQHERAVSGKKGGPLGQPAQRVRALYKYDRHPNDYNEAQTASADVLKSELSDLIEAMKDENGVVALDQLAIEVRGLSHPMKEPEAPFASRFKMEEVAQIELGFN